MTTQTDRDIAVAAGLVAALHENNHNSLVTVFVEMYRRHLSGDKPMSVGAAFVLANFMHGEVGASAIKAARDAGYITTEVPEGSKKAILHPTEKLITLMQTIVGVEGFCFETAEKHRKRAEIISGGMKHFDAMRPELERDHMNERIAISCMTGRYVVDDGDVAKRKVFSESLEEGDFVFFTTVRPKHAPQC